MGFSVGTLLAHAGLSLLPVILFLFGLNLVDTYKLMSLRGIVRTVGVGLAVAAVCYGFNTAVFMWTPIPARQWARFGAPALEEICKALYLVWLIRTHRVAFLVDSAVSGFAVGAGFAILENLTYLPELTTAGLAAAAVRGLGTAMMHGGTTAVFGIVSVNRAEIRGTDRLTVFLPGLLIAIVIHTLYNQPLLPREISAGLVLVALPAVLSLIIWQSEKALKEWLGTKLDKDIDLLNMIATGTFSSSHAGSYLKSLENTFAPVILGDMLCYLQMSLELSARAKGDMLRREMGFPLSPDPELPGQLKELAYLEGNMGRAGILALSPLLGTSHRDIWELKHLTAE
ncbi:MAG: PrsW family glutamic-type intramembrane protease [Bryobacteraceae bacterium]